MIEDEIDSEEEEEQQQQPFSKELNEECENSFKRTLDKPCISINRKKVKKDPTVDTSFLPDREREEDENRLREELRQQWAQQQQKLKDEEIEITFSYWDGSGHRKTVRVKKG